MKKERKDKSFIKKPIYPGGSTAMRSFISQNLIYPTDALTNGIQGTVSLKYTIDHKGNVIDTHVVAGLGQGCDEEAQRVVRLFRFEVPKTRGVRVTFHKDIHVHFRLSKKKPTAPPVSTQYVYTSVSPSAKSTGTAYTYNYTISITQHKKEK